MSSRRSLGGRLVVYRLGIFAVTVGDDWCARNSHIQFLGFEERGGDIEPKLGGGGIKRKKKWMVSVMKDKKKAITDPYKSP